MERGINELTKWQLEKAEDFDYTSWQREHYDKMTPEKIYAGVVRNGKTHPFQGKKAVII